MFRKNLARIMAVAILMVQLNMGYAAADPLAGTEVGELLEELVEPVEPIEPIEPVDVPLPESDQSESGAPVPERLNPVVDALVIAETQIESVDNAASTVVDSQDIDLTDPLIAEKYFVVQYDDGSIEIRQVEQSEILGVMATDPVTPGIQSEMQNFEQKNDVKHVEPLVVRKIADTSAIGPNDPKYIDNSLWGYSAVRADQLHGWNYTQGLSNVVIAILDTGMDMDHPDLAGSLASVNRGDGNMVHGYDAVGTVLTTAPEAPTPVSEMDYSPDDDHGHGTHVSGTAAAIANNGIGIAGVAGGVKILPVKVLGDDGYGTSANVIEGIDWAVAHGADIISMSLGSSVFSQLEQDAINRAHAAGVTVVAATGNNSNNWSDGPADIPMEHYPTGTAIVNNSVSYPAACNYVIGVGSVGMHGLLSDFSNSGPKVDVVAPGEYIYSTYLNNTYASSSGTSMATPHVAGLAALILAENPHFSPSQVESAIKNDADMILIGSLYGGNSSYYGSGLIDAFGSIGSYINQEVTLDAISIDVGTLSFNTATTSYTTTVNYDTEVIGIRPTKDNEYQVVKINDVLYSGSGYHTVDLNPGSNIITIRVTAKDTITDADYTLTVNRPYHTVLDSGTQSVSLAGKSPSDTVVLDIPEAVTHPNVTVTVLTAGGLTTSTLPAVTASRTVSGTVAAKMEIASGTVVSALAGAGWGGTINLPTVKETASVSPAGSSVNKVIDMGFAGGTLTFDKAVRLVFYGLEDKSIGYIKDGEFYPITALLSSDSQTAGDGLAPGGDGRISSGGDLVVWTKHFTEFVVYTPADVQPPPVSSGGGGGGGGGGGSSAVEVIVKTNSTSVMETDAVKVSFAPNSYFSEFRASMNAVGYSTSPFKGSQRLMGKVFILDKNIDQEIEKPMEITFAVKLKEVDLEKERLALFYLDPKANRWKELSGTTVDTSKGIVTGSSLLFTEYAVLAILKEEPIPVAVPEVPVIPVPQLPAFTDMTGHWASDKVNDLVAKKAISGYPDGSFKPEAPITRGEFLTVLVKAQGMTGTKELPFSDVEGHWARDGIRIGYANGVTSGFLDGLFRPNDPITREQMAAMVNRTLRYASESPQLSLKDQDDISPWATDAIAKMTAFKVMGGYPDGTFRPQAFATRAEAATVILNTITN